MDTQPTLHAPETHNSALCGGYAAPLYFRGGLAPRQKRRVIAHIEANLDKPLTCGTLAELVGLSTSYFNRAFKSSFGRSPHSYLISRRLERAQDMLLATDEPISQIALACGLADQCHLCRLFRKLVGESPAAWRRVRRT
jgi:AraC family transcriptional regulator